MWAKYKLRKLGTSRKQEKATVLFLFSWHFEPKMFALNIYSDLAPKPYELNHTCRAGASWLTTRKLGELVFAWTLLLLQKIFRSLCTYITKDRRRSYLKHYYLLIISHCTTFSSNARRYQNLFLLAFSSNTSNYRPSCRCRWRQLLKRKQHCSLKSLSCVHLDAFDLRRQ